MEVITYEKQEIVENRKISESDYTSFVDWIDRGEATTKAYLTNLRQWAAWCAYREIERPMTQDVRDFRDWLSSPHEAIQYDPAAGWSFRADKTGRPLTVECKPSTVRLYVRTVKQFFAWTAAQGIYPDIAQTVRIPKTDRSHKKDALTLEQIRDVEAAIEEAGADKVASASFAKKDAAGRTQRAEEQKARERAMYLLMVTAGLRDVEIHRADVKDFARDGKAGAWLYVWGKGHAEADQRKAIAPCAADAVTDYLKVRSDGAPKDSPLFVSTGNRSGGSRIATTTISKMMKRSMQKAGIDDPRKTAHSLRHTAAAMMMDATDNNIYLVRDYMRHSNTSTTEIYLDRESDAADQRLAMLYDQMLTFTSNNIQ